MKNLTRGKGQRPGIRFNSNGVETRKNILHTTGMLFSVHGYAGTSFRDITRASKIGLGSLVYHFGVKENLFYATVSNFFPTEARMLEIVEPLTHCTAESTKEEINEAVFKTVSSYLKDMHCNRKASFMAKFVARLKLDATPETRRLLEERTVAARMEVISFAKRVNPALSDEQAMAWRRCLVSQVDYTLFNDKEVLAEFKLRSFTPAAIETIARSIAEISYPLLLK